MAILYTDALDKKHSAPLLSMTTLITYTLFLLIIILPLMLVVRTHSKQTEAI
jgi:hypothetical protein